MIHSLQIEDFTYDLPPERIAVYPLERRDQSKLLVHRGQSLTSSQFFCIDEYLETGSLLVLNNTRVVQARLIFRKPTGGIIELFCLQPVLPTKDVHHALGLPSPSVWQCLVGHAKKWKHGVLERTLDGGVVLSAEKLEHHGETFLIRFSWSPDTHSLGEVLEMAGETPLPPYINRTAEPDDKLRYQTIFAQNEGSVAAPTAGLHFTPEVFAKLAHKGITPAYITLHVGAGTFKPISNSHVGEHQMHCEQFVVERTLVEAIQCHTGVITCVGTTSMRTLESLYWIGAKLNQGHRPASGIFLLNQWAPYAWEGEMPGRSEAMKAILHYLDESGETTIHGETSLMIVPGYSFKMTDALITNFHQPRSTLLLLVAAFVGNQWKDVYQYALGHAFRFLSYGDSCLFYRQGLRSAE